MEGVPQQRSWFRRNMAWVIPVGCLGLIALGCVIFGGVAALVGGKYIQAEKQAVDRLEASLPAAVRNNALVVENLGQPVEVGRVRTGGYNNFNGVAQVKFSAPISGPRAQGTLHGLGSHPKGKNEYEITELTLELADGHTVNVLERL